MSIEYDDFEENEDQNGYDRERSIAVLTGIVAMLVSLAGTVLGSYHAITTIGVIAGSLSTACYAIADLVVYWSARIDYKESGNAMEWTAWAVKYGLSFLLLFIGGCVAYILFSTGDLDSTRTATAQRAQQAFSDCLAKGGKQRICQNQFDLIMTDESNDTKQRLATQLQSNAWIDKVVSHPLFNYVSGIAGVLGLLALSLVAKLIAKTKKAKSIYQKTVGVKQRKTVPAFEIKPKPTVYKMISNGKQSFRLRRQKGRGRSIQISWRSNKRELHCGRISPEEAEIMQHLGYTEFARKIIELMKTEGLNSVEIENSLN